MRGSEIQFLSKPQLSRPTFILGLSDPYEINEIVIQLLIEHTRSKKFAEFYSPYLPDYIIAEQTGICHLLRYDIYAGEVFKPNTVIMTGESSPNSEDSKAHYEIFSSIFDFVENLGCRRFLTFGAFQMEKTEDRIYVAATTSNLVSSITEKLGGKPFIKGRIDGQIGMIVGLAKIHELPGICVLGLSHQDISKEDTAQKIFHYITEVLALQN